METLTLLFNTLDLSTLLMDPSALVGVIDKAKSLLPVDNVKIPALEELGKKYEGGISMANLKDLLQDITNVLDGDSGDLLFKAVEAMS